MRGGGVSVDGEGLNANSTDYAAIIVRAAQINAGIWAKDLSVVTGANQVVLQRRRLLARDQLRAVPLTARFLAACSPIPIGGDGGGRRCSQCWEHCRQRRSTDRHCRCLQCTRCVPRFNRQQDTCGQYRYHCNSR